MEVVQIYNIMNTVTSEVLGRTEVVTEDLSNIVDIGTEIFNANAVDRYVRSLVNHIGRVIFVNRPYRGSVPSVLMDGWEFGSVMEKIAVELPNASENESWELTDGASYDPNIFYQPKVYAKFFNKKVTFEIDMSFTEKQVKQSFSNATQLNAFLSMLYDAVDRALTVKIDSLVMRTINNMTAMTLRSEYEDDAGYADASGVRAVNLLKLYKNRFADAANMTAEQAMTTPEFIRFAVLTMSNYIDRLAKLSVLFNIGGKERFTPKDLLHVIMLSDFKNAAGVYLQSDTFHDQYTALPNAETVPYWQGPGTSYSFNEISDIHVNIAQADGSTEEVAASGILAVMFDRDALGVTNQDRRVTTHYNPKAEFFTNFYKFDAGYFNDANENFVVFFVA